MHENCDCEGCKMKREGLSEDEVYNRLREKDNELIEKYGFVVHGVPCNAHTHGLELKNHLNFQIVLNIPPDISQQIFWTFVNRINEGEIFRPNTYVTGIIENYSVQLLKATTDENEEVLRVIFPDVEGLFPHQVGCNKEFAKQNEGCLIFVGNSKKIR